MMIKKWFEQKFEKMIEKNQNFKFLKWNMKYEKWIPLPGSPWIYPGLPTAVISRAKVALVLLAVIVHSRSAMVAEEIFNHF